MLRQYFEKPRVLRGIESPEFMSYLDSFAQELGSTGSYPKPASRSCSPVRLGGGARNSSRELRWGVCCAVSAAPARVSLPRT
jgi:hypothetical protein